MDQVAKRGTPHAGNPHVRFDEGEVASAATPRRGSLLYRNKPSNRGLTLATAATLTGVPGMDASLGDNRVSVGGGKLRVGAPGMMLIFR